MNARKGFDAKELWLLERDLDRYQAGGRPKPEEEEQEEEE